MYPLSVSDQRSFYLLNIKPEIRKYLWDDEIITEEKSVQIIEENLKLFRTQGFGLWRVGLKDLNALIGYAGLWYFFDEDQPQLIYVIDPFYQRRNYAVHAGELIIDYAFHRLGFGYLTAATDLGNDASIRVLEKLKMEKMEMKDVGGRPTVFP